MDNKELFLKTLDELESRIKSKDTYDILMSAGLLRKLILDGKNSLATQVKKPGERLTFNVNYKEPLHIRKPVVFKERDLNTYKWLIEEGINPDKADKTRDYNPQSLDLDKFLKYVVIFVSGKEITIKELIRHLANKEGAIHKQRRPLISLNEAKNILLRELGEAIKVKNIPAGISTLKGIGEVVLNSLRALDID